MNIEKKYMAKERIALSLIALIMVLSLVAVLQIEPIAQDLAYHNFADAREMFQISNFWNVVSNLGFLLVGFYALYKLFVVKSLLIVNEIKIAYTLFFLAIVLVSFGSSYYHLDPNNETLLWDRLPMTIAFMALFSSIIAEFISVKIGRVVLFPLLVFGMGSVLYWFFGELEGMGDLRAYVLVQFLPIVIMPMIFTLFSSSFSLVKGYWLLLLCYLVAKVFEYFDAQIYEILGVISGHSLKHMISALGVFILVRSFERRYGL